ncbi:plastocyanin/azurin family copper-binding protein [Pedobacter sp. B4-66]|uniref:plastocyanin/azurin family copper-binding protein n=1 Tax=Pedobacter sp. B4-66 TaxID=2817280 RepID=UPI001BDA481A|nr:plastocyanin/azurin family copper-binding protein [Pedobacter sp. B4-66]
MNKYGICFVLIAFLSASCSLTSEKPKVYTVEIKDMKFMPDDITVKQGDTVVWINRDMMAHDVTEEGEKRWTSSLIPPGSSWKKEITSTANYYCSIHVVMKGKIRVQ